MNIMPCPINAITYVYPETMTSYTYLLREKNNPQIQEHENNIEGLKKYLRETLREDFEFKIFFFDSELKLITEFFKQVNADKPDYCMAWNQKFDILTLCNRIDILGGNRNEIICHPDFPEEYQYAYFTEDTKAQKPGDKNDWFNCASYTVFIDQLLIFAQLRKGRGEFESYSLNFIAEQILKDGKLDYTDSSNIKTLPYDDYAKFVAYNIKDVFLLYELEKKNDDMNMLYSLAKTTRTRVSKAMRKTVSLKNLAVKFYDMQGYIMGNNVNVRIDNEGEAEVTEKFEGAVVADPELNGYNGMMINGKRSKYVYTKVIDFDLSSLYPSIIRAFNIDTTTQYGRLFIDGITPTKENDPALAFIDRLTTKNYINLGKDYYGLPSPTDLARELLNKKKGMNNGN